MFHLAYTNHFEADLMDDMKELCQFCVDALHEAYPSLKEKIKIHLLLHLIEDMESFCPAVSFCTERYYM